MPAWRRPPPWWRPNPSSRPTVSGRRLEVIVGCYALLSSAWILLSDVLLHTRLEGVGRAETLAQTGKGLAFVALTSAALYLLLRQTFRDVGAAENARHDSDRRFYSLLDSIRDQAVMLLDPTGRILRCNDGAAKILGWQPSELVGHHLGRLYREQDVEQGAIDRILAEAAERGRFEHDVWHCRKDGTRFWANVAVTRLADEAGRITGYVTITRDITARREAEDMRQAAARRLLERERQARLMMDSSVDGLITIDEDGAIESFSGAAARIFARPAAQMLGRRITELMPERYHTEVLARLRRGDAGGQNGPLAFDGEVEGLGEGGHVFPLDLVVAEVSPEGGKRRFVCTVRDLTERKAFERQIRHAQRMEAVGQLTGGLAHDFNNLLSVTVGCAELLQDRLVADERGHKLTETILEAGRRGADLTQRLLAFARRQPLEPAEIGLRQLIDELEPLLARTLGEDIDIAVDLPDPAPKVLADPVQLENALLNLAINARDAMPGGGRVTISAGPARLDADYVRHNPDAAAGDYVAIAVSDTGTGMSTEVLERAFDPFFTTKVQGRGSGLGLSMIYGFARQSGGHAKIYSEAGVGTTVRLYLPPAPDMRPHEIPAGRSTEELPGGSETILVVEDDELVRAFVCDQLRVLGYRVVAVSDGPSALAELDSGRPIDVLFTDVVMPGGMNGRELAEKAIVLRPGLKLLFTSGYTEDVIVLQGKLAPGSQLLNKPYVRAALARKLRAVIDGAAA